jgi:phage tail-like protein
MAISAAEQRVRYPLTTYSYRVSLGGAEVSFSELSGLTIDYETTTYRHGLSFAEGEIIVRQHLDKYVPLTLKKGVVYGLKVLCDWLASGETRTLDINLCNEQGAPAVTWHIVKAIPVKLSGPTLSASGNEVAIDSLELRVTGISIEHH